MPRPPKASKQEHSIVVMLEKDEKEAFVEAVDAGELKRSETGRLLFQGVWEGHKRTGQTAEAIVDRMRGAAERFDGQLISVDGVLVDGGVRPLSRLYADVPLHFKLADKAYGIICAGHEPEIVLHRAVPDGSILTFVPVETFEEGRVYHLAHQSGLMGRDLTQSILRLAKYDAAKGQCIFDLPGASGQRTVNVQDVSLLGRFAFDWLPL